mmetsp:Transcript_75735/g.234397  ORF Transcript_75735/g.234397 Transcript_75735/m.234397 type:complete len:219 (+) Transcript_75735:74-730(+)|eukprot:CAMPEP_0204552340 /NCGR_PEP_ID=MMETSP0661-20131031/26533_1 /ASSEMBLY_ACC=CAM_ASM_000606 /TAXON_ID=109239 /ORGANISM="Alexandrium margalefi, Strain AMGDE01CS-322" /LENGTH=218 /DNA_ID=CAMNT_0051559347 /DNA_START=28 /DNA_END=684 /DNA_ORIENTATION=-
MATEGAEEELLDGWERKKSRSTGQVYFLHPESGRTQWDPPLKRRRTVEDSAAAATPAPWDAPASGGGGGGGGDGLFAGLPEAASTTCAPKESIAAAPPKPILHVRALHLLKKHAGSRRPSSWREKVITRSLEEATHALKELRKRLAGFENDEERRLAFERLARKESDCGSAHEGGSLGRFKRGQMQPAFEEAAFSLKVNELSGIVTTDSGVHIILRLE